MSEFDGKRTKEDVIPTIQVFEGIGELAVGGSVSGGDVNRILFTSLAMLNAPLVNSYLLANKVMLTDRTTKTKIFPRAGMDLLGGETYIAPQEEVPELPTEQENP